MPIITHDFWKVTLSCRKLTVKPDANIYNLRSRLEYAKHWQQEFKALDEFIDIETKSIMSEADFAEYKRLQAFHSDVSEMLRTIAEILTPQTFDELLQYGLEGLIAEKHYTLVKSANYSPQ